MKNQLWVIKKHGGEYITIKKTLKYKKMEAFASLIYALREKKMFYDHGYIPRWYQTEPMQQNKQFSMSVSLITYVEQNYEFGYFQLHNAVCELLTYFPTDVDRCLSCIHLRSHMIGNIKKPIFFSVHNHDIFLWNSCFLCNWEAFLCKPCPVYCVIIESANKIWYAALMTWHFLMQNTVDQSCWLVIS